MSLEVSKKNAWHPHINILACTEEEILVERWTDKYGKNQYTNSQLKNEWKEITNWSFIHYINKKDPAKDIYNRSGLGKVFKYIIKFQDMEVADLAQFMEL